MKLRPLGGNCRAQPLSSWISIKLLLLLRRAPDTLALPVFQHLVEKIPSIHAVLPFVSVMHLPLPYADTSERFLFRQVASNGGSRVFRCVARYVGRDWLEQSRDFAAGLVERLQYYICNINLYGCQDMSRRCSSKSFLKNVVLVTVKMAGMMDGSTGATRLYKVQSIQTLRLSKTL